MKKLLIVLITALVFMSGSMVILTHLDAEPIEESETARRDHQGR